MHADDLTKPLMPTPRKQRRAGFLPIVAVTLSGILAGLAILFATPDRDKPLSPAPATQPAVAESVQQTAVVPALVPAMPTAKTVTLTVIDSQTGARREVIVPASNDQSEEGKPTPARSAAAITPADTPGARAAKSKRHSGLSSK
jgi:hypothetical protein